MGWVNGIGKQLRVGVKGIGKRLRLRVGFKGIGKKFRVGVGV